MPFITIFIDGSYPTDTNIYVVFFIYLLQVVTGYLFYGYSTAIFQANQKLDITMRNSSIVWLICYSLQIFALCVCDSYYVFAGILVVGATGVGISNRICHKKMFPQYKIIPISFKQFGAQFWETFIKRIVSMAFSKLRNVLRNSIDVVVVSSVLGLVYAAIYQNYILVMTVPVLLISSIMGGILPSLGNSVAMESSESNYDKIKLISFANHWIATMFAAFLLCFYQPFIRLWAGADNILSNTCVILLCIYFYIRAVSEIPMLVRNSSGIWWEGKWVAIAESLLNLVLNLIFVKIWGIEGIILATIISMLVLNIPFETYYVYKYYLKKNPTRDLLKYLLDGAKTAVVVAITFLASRLYHGGWITTFIYYGVVCVVVPNVLLSVLHFNSSEFKSLRTLIVEFVKKEL